MPWRDLGVRTAPLLAAVPLALACPAPPPVASGPVVEEVRAGVGAAAAGILAGDVLLRWERQVSGPIQPAAAGVFESWGDVWEIERNHAPKGVIAVTLERQGRRRRVTLPVALWELTARPALNAEDLELYASARWRIAHGQAEAGRRRFEQLLGRLSPADRAWAWMRWAEALEDAGEEGKARRAWNEGARGSSGRERAQLLEEQGRALRRMGSFSEAESALLAALKLRRAQTGGELGVAWVLLQLANLYRAGDDAERAEWPLEEALLIVHKQAPGGSLEGDLLNTRGNLAALRRDLAAADRAYRDALAVQERNGVPAPSAFVNLAWLAQIRGELSRAEAHLERAAVLSRDHGGIKAASVLIRLAQVRLERGDLDGAERAFAECRTSEFDASGLATCEAGSGRTALARGDLERAEGLLALALEGRRRTQPGGAGEAEVLELLGEVALARGSGGAAAERLRRAVEMRRRTAPASVDLARSLGLLARAERRRGRAIAALTAFEEAAAAAEAQQRWLGGGQLTPVSFNARVAWIYAEWVELLVDLGRIDEAFMVFERSRARALRALVAEQGRDLATPEVPENARPRRELAAAIDRGYTELAATSLADEAAQRRARLHLEHLLDRWEVLEDRSGGLQQPEREPRSVAAPRIRRQLPKGALLLAYSLGERSGVIFALPASGPLRVHPLAGGRVEIGSLARAFQREIEAGRRHRRRAPEPIAARLSELLLAPAASELASAERLILVPDGALHRLPFAALPDPTSARGELVAERRSLQLVASASHWAELQARPRPERPWRLVALANPEASPAAAALFGAERLAPLPWTEVESAAVARHFPGAQVFVGREASEAALRAAAPRAELVHLGCHAVVDERLPLSSALVLTASGEASGLLHAWEVIEEVRLAAELVTLSACDSAVAETVSGEGLLGFTWALQRAGARAVLASLWRVEDEAAALFMERFYRHLAAGDEKPEALRRAQLAFLGAPLEVERNRERRLLDLRHPRHWAGFVLIGD